MTSHAQCTLMITTNAIYRHKVGAGHPSSTSAGTAARGAPSSGTLANPAPDVPHRLHVRPRLGHVGGEERRQLVRNALVRRQVQRERRQQLVEHEARGVALAALQQCEQVEPSCGMDGESYLVFPDVTSVALGVGGEGGEGALIRNGQVVDYYNMGEASIGLQAGVSAASYVFKMPNQEALAEFEDDGEWSIGAESSLVIANADANAATETAGDQLNNIPGDA